MASLKKDKLLSLFLGFFLLFNLLFFFRSPVINWWYDRINVYEKCAEASPDASDLYQVQSCDLESISKIDDIILGLFAVSAIGSAITASMLISRTIERRWNKKRRSS